MNVKTNIGKSLQSLRKFRGYSLSYVANLTGKKRSTIHLYEKDKISISVETLILILNVYDYSLIEFFKDIEIEILR